MTRSCYVRVVGLAFASFVGGFHVISMAQSYPAILTGGELQRVVPTSFYFEGQAGPTQMRNAAAVRLAEKSYVVAALVDTSGYSSDVRGKYEGFLITDSPISLGGAELGTGAYGFGFASDGKVNIFDVGGKQILSTESKKDDGLKGPRPLMMTKAADGVRLYKGKNYVTIALK
jgi:hypothetical protein